MKKILTVLVCVMMFVMPLAGCGSAKDEPAESEETNTEIANPIHDITLEEMASEAGLKEIKLENVTQSVKIDTDPVIYSIDTDVYTVRFEKSEDGQDISGVYLDGDIHAVIYDTADINTAPSITVQGDLEYTVATGCWNGYTFSVIGPHMSFEELQQITMGYVQTLLCADNIA